MSTGAVSYEDRPLTIDYIENNSQLTLTYIKHAMDNIVRVLRDTYYNWIYQHGSGLLYCRMIAKIGAKYTTARKNREKYRTDARKWIENSRLLKLLHDLHGYQKGLTQIVQQLELCVQITRTILYELKTLLFTIGNNEQNLVIYRKWKIKDFVKFFEKVLQNYELEYNVKSVIAHLIKESDTANDLRYLRSAWQNRLFLLSTESRRAMTSQFLHEIKNAF